MTIQIHPDPEALARAAAELFAQAAREAVRARGRFVVSLSGGNTPRRAYQLLAEPPLRDAVPWNRVHIFFGDERCVPPDDHRGNALMARQALLDHVAIPSGQIHAIICGGDPEEAAAAYEADLRGFFAANPPRFDLVFLGLGEDGHTASLFPHTPVLSEQDRWTAAVCPPTQELCRVTLTAPVINRSAIVAFLASGEAKAAILREVLEGPRDPRRLPAQLIHPTDGRLLWLLDQPAARDLSRP